MTIAGVGGNLTRTVTVNATVATPPAAPVLSAKPGNASVSLSWTVPANGGSPITGYNVYRATASGAETLLKRLGNVTGFRDTGLNNGTVYYYRLSAVNGIGEGALSAERSAKPQARF